MVIDYFTSPVGILRLKASAKGLTDLNIVDEISEEIEPSSITDLAKTQLKDYFEGKKVTFDIPLDFESGTAFYQQVWKELLSIPYGRTTSYLDIAKALGDANATRAVGLANGKNPIAIIVPCHRVIGSNGSLTGYAYGTKIKRKLLALENPMEYAENGVLF